MQTAKVLNPRIMRWAMKLQPYRFGIVAIRGRDNLGADYLSRLDLTRHRIVVVYIGIFCFETFYDSFSFCTTKVINMFCHVFFLPKGIHMLRNEMHHRGFGKIIGHQLIVGKYDTTSICSARTICEILPRFYHVFAETCNYRILFYSVSDYINQHKIISRGGILRQ